MDSSRPKRAYDPNERAFDWCYTFNDVPQDPAQLTRLCDDLHADLDAALDAGDLRHYAFQSERGRKTGHLHVHVFCQFRERQRGMRLRGLLRASSPFRPLKPNVLPRLGSPEECEVYHSKEETRLDGPYSGGELQVERRGQGKRTDLDRVAERIRSGDGVRQLATDFTTTYIRYHRGILAAIDVLHQPKALDADPGMGRSLRLPNSIPFR